MFIHFERYAYISTRVESLSGPQKRLKRKEPLRMSRGFKVSFWIRLDEWVVKSNAGGIIQKRRSLEIYFKNLRIIPFQIMFILFIITQVPMTLRRIQTIGTHY